MTSIEIIRQRLLALPAIVAIVGSRVYTLFLPQNFHGDTAIRLQRVSQRPALHLRGTGGFWTDRVQVDAFATTLEGSYALDAALVGDGCGSALAGFTGNVGTARVHALFPDTVREFVDPEETRLIRVMRDYFLAYTEAGAVEQSRGRSAVGAR